MVQAWSLPMKFDTPDNRFFLFMNPWYECSSLKLLHDIDYAAA
jgi:hypothetical protein